MRAWVAPAIAALLAGLDAGAARTATTCRDASRSGIEIGRKKGCRTPLEAVVALGLTAVLGAACAGAEGRDKTTSANLPLKSPSSNASSATTDIAREARSDFPGVRIRFKSPKSTWSLAEARAGIHIGYEVRIDQDVEGVVPVAQDAGQCDLPGPSGLVLFEALRGSQWVLFRTSGQWI